MAQNLQPGRSDNRGGNKPKTSTKKLFIYRVERSKHEELRAYAIKLNEEVEAEKSKRYTLLMQNEYTDGRLSKIIDLEYDLSFEEAHRERIFKEKELNSSDFAKTMITISEIENTPDPCNTTEK